MQDNKEMETLVQDYKAMVEMEQQVQLVDLLLREVAEEEPVLHLHLMLLLVDLVAVEMGLLVEELQQLPEVVILVVEAVIMDLVEMEVLVVELEIAQQLVEQVIHLLFAHHKENQEDQIVLMEIQLQAVAVEF